MTETEILKESILSLQTALLEAHPTIPTLLQEIHSFIKANPEQVTLLSEEDIEVIVRGLSRQTAIEISVKAKPASKAARLKAITVDDL
jgi:hypothetical protein